MLGVYGCCSRRFCKQSRKPTMRKVKKGESICTAVSLGSAQTPRLPINSFLTSSTDAIADVCRRRFSPSDASLAHFFKPHKNRSRWEEDLVHHRRPVTSLAAPYARPPSPPEAVR